jgi:protein tyrosine phosphatase
MNDHLKNHNGIPFNFHYIDDGIYLGSSQCCIAGLNELLQKEGISADISLEEQSVDSPFGVLVYLWLPTKDLTAPHPDALSLGISALAKLVDQKRKVYVHCRNGHGRAPTLVMAYMMIAHNMTAEEAEKFVCKKRPVVHLEEAQRIALQKLKKQ